MKRIAFLSLSVILLAATACKKEEAEKPKVIYENPEKSKAQPEIDSSGIEIADLPLHIPGTSYLIHPIGDYRLYDSKNRSSGYGYEKGGSFTVSNYSEYEIAGFLENLKFQEMSSDSIVALTDKPVLIQTATYLKAFADKTKQQIMVYTLADRDTNKDGKLDASDIKSLYISDMGGGRFTKISSELQELVDWNLIESKNRLYFRTIEDTNKNGEFDKDDVLHYNYLDLTSKDGWKVEKYNPI